MEILSAGKEAVTNYTNDTNDTNTRTQSFVIRSIPLSNKSIRVIRVIRGSPFQRKEQPRITRMTRITRTREHKVETADFVIRSIPLFKQIISCNSCNSWLSLVPLSRFHSGLLLFDAGSDFGGAFAGAAGSVFTCFPMQ